MIDNTSRKKKPSICPNSATHDVTPGVKLEVIETLRRHPLERHRSLFVLHRVVIFLVNVASQAKVRDFHQLLCIDPGERRRGKKLFITFNFVIALMVLKSCEHNIHNTCTYMTVCMYMHVHVLTDQLCFG